MKLGETCNNCGLKCTSEHKVVTDLRDGTKMTGYADPCLGVLPGVMFACCGHDNNYDGYIWFENGVRMLFDLTNVQRYTMSKYHAFNEQTVKVKKTTPRRNMKGK